MERGWGLPFRTWARAEQAGCTGLESPARGTGLLGVHTEHHADLPLLPPPFLDEDGSAWQPTGSGTDGGSWEWGVSVPQPLGVSLSPSPCPRTKGRCLEELLGEGAQGRCLWPLDIHWPSQRAVTVSSEGS